MHYFIVAEGTAVAWESMNGGDLTAIRRLENGKALSPIKTL
jgi:hypothetical protein